MPALQITACFFVTFVINSTIAAQSARRAGSSMRARYDASVSVVGYVFCSGIRTSMSKVMKSSELPCDVRLG